MTVNGLGLRIKKGYVCHDKISNLAVFTVVDLSNSNLAVHHKHILSCYVFPINVIEINLTC